MIGVRREQATSAVPSLGIGALAGGIVTAAFLVLHDAVISDIWFNAVPMVLSGALCGSSLAWSYGTLPARSGRAWWAYNAACVAVLVALGVVSLLTMEPEFTMAEVMDMDDPLGRLLPLGVPLMAGGTVVGSALIWLAFGRGARSVVPILVTQALLVFLIGHNLAILGAVEIPSDMLYLVGEFVGLTLFLGAGFAATAALLVRTFVGRGERGGMA